MTISRLTAERKGFYFLKNSQLVAEEWLHNICEGLTKGWINSSFDTVCNFWRVCVLVSLFDVKQYDIFR